VPASVNIWALSPKIICVVVRVAAMVCGRHERECARALCPGGQRPRLVGWRLVRGGENEEESSHAWERRRWGSGRVECRVGGVGGEEDAEFFLSHGRQTDDPKVIVAPKNCPLFSLFSCERFLRKPHGRC
jgi:hypothetical protein